MKKKKKNKITSEQIKNIIIIVLILVIIIGGIFLLGRKNDDEKKDQETKTSSEKISKTALEIQEESASIKDEEQKEMIAIDIDKYLELEQGDEVSLIYVARPTCQFCQIQTPIIRNIAYKYDLDLYYLNTDDMDVEASKKFVNSDESFNDGVGTPSILVVQNDQILGRVEGLNDSKTITNLFKKIGLIL